MCGYIKIVLNRFYHNSKPEKSLFRQKCRHSLPWMLSYLPHSVQPVSKIASK